MLTPDLLTTMMMAKVSETTGRLTAPVLRARLAQSPNTRWEAVVMVFRVY